MRRIALILMLCPAIASGGDWQVLRGDAVLAALKDRRVFYESGAWQSFNGSGRTLYNAGQDSWGYWRVQGDQYCSMWPPSDIWACYDFARAGNKIRFIGASGEMTDGRYDPD